MNEKIRVLDLKANDENGHIVRPWSRTGQRRGVA
jgi:hypothetical protein